MPEPIPPRLTELLRRWSLWAVLAFGAVVFSAAIRSPYMLDDFLHASMVRGTYPGGRGAFDLYNFVDDGNRADMMAVGIVPWWTHPGLVIRFFRPLSSVLRWGDLHLLSTSPLLQHIHSLIWWALAVVAVGALARRAFSPRVSAIATFVFALSPCHSIPLAWLANREALVSLALGAFALNAYARWRDDARPLLALAATSLFALALLSGEYAIGFGGYVVAIELVRRKDGVARRVVGLAPFAVPLAVYLFFHMRGAYGVVGSGFYLDPFVDARPFLENAPLRLAQLLLDAWWTIDGRITWVPGWLLAIELVVAAAAFAIPLRRALAALDDSARATAAWLVVGSVLSLAPALAVLPSVRLLGVAMIGISVAVGLVLDRAWFPSERSTAPWRSSRAALELLARSGSPSRTSSARPSDRGSDHVRFAPAPSSTRPAWMPFVSAIRATRRSSFRARRRRRRSCSRRSCLVEESCHPLRTSTFCRCRAVTSSRFATGRRRSRSCRGATRRSLRGPTICSAAAPLRCMSAKSFTCPDST